MKGLFVVKKELFKDQKNIIGIFGYVYNCRHPKDSLTQLEFDCVIYIKWDNKIDNDEEAFPYRVIDLLDKDENSIIVKDINEGEEYAVCTLESTLETEDGYDSYYSLSLATHFVGTGKEISQYLSIMKRYIEEDK